MGAASVHTLPRRQAGIDDDGEIEAGMPTTLEAAWDVIQTFERKFRAACGQITRLQNELEGKRVAEIEAKAVEEVLEYWRQKCAPKAEIVAGSPKWERVRARLHEKPKGRGHRTVDELKEAVDGALADEWFNGTHPDSPGYLGWDNIFLNSDRVEKLIGFARERWDRDFDERLRAFHETHPSAVFEAIERERQVSELAVLDPSVFLPESGEVAAEVVRYEQTVSDDSLAERSRANDERTT